MAREPPRPKRAPTAGPTHIRRGPTSTALGRGTRPGPSTAAGRPSLHSWLAPPSLLDLGVEVAAGLGSSVGVLPRSGAEASGPGGAGRGRKRHRETAHSLSPGLSPPLQAQHRPRPAPRLIRGRGPVPSEGSPRSPFPEASSSLTGRPAGPSPFYFVKNIGRGGGSALVRSAFLL